MKIGVAIPTDKFYYKDPGKRVMSAYHPIYDVLYSLPEIKAFCQSRGISPLKTQEICDIKQFLEDSAEFIQEVEKFRKVFAIPENIDYSLFHEDPLYYMDSATNEEKKAVLAKIKAYLDGVKKQFDMPILLSYVIKDVFCTGVLPLEFMMESRINFGRTPTCVVLRICSNDVSQNEIKEFLSANWKDLKKDIASLPHILDFDLDERERRVLELTKEGKTLKPLTDDIANEFDKQESSFSENSVKAVRDRAKKKRALVFKRRN